MFETLLQSSYFALFLIIALGFMLGRIQIKGLSLDVSAVIFIALLFGHFGVIIPKELGNMGLVLFIFTIGIQAGPGFFDSFRSKGKTLIILTLLIVGSACLTGILFKYILDIDTPSIVGLIAGALTSTPGLAVAIDSTQSSCSIHRLWHRLSVRRNRRDPFRETIAQNASQGFDSRGQSAGSPTEKPISYITYRRI